jgi:DNA-binding NarL/FixJ family response regulator
MTSKQEEDQASPQPSPQAVPSLSERRAKSWIVLVDDEESIRNAVGQLFQSQGYRHVTTCEDGRSALQAALSNQDAKDIKHGETQHYQQQQQQQQGSVLVVGSGSSGGRVPDCIVSDIRMPGMDGLELLQRIRENDTLRQVPVVLLTAKGMTSDRIAGYDSGADAYLSKPFAPEELIAIVDNVIQRHDMLAEVAAEQESKNNVKVEDLKRDLDEIKNLLLHKGGGGVGNGWVEQTNVFLSRDELEVLELLSQGLRNKEIASKTHLSTRRIEQLLTRMFRKTGVKNRTELVRWAVSTGYVE